MALTVAIMLFDKEMQLNSVHLEFNMSRSFCDYGERSLMLKRELRQFTGSQCHQLNKNDSVRRSKKKKEETVDQ